MWPLAIAMFAIAMLTTQFAKQEPNRFEGPRNEETAKQALQYATSVSIYLSNNPGASTPATVAQLNLPSWFPKNCNSQPCFNHAFAGGKAYITLNPSISLGLDSINQAQDGSILTGVFTNLSSGSFQSQYGVITLPVPAGTSLNTPTIVVGP